MWVDTNGISARETDYETQLSICGIGEARGYNFCIQDLFGVFSLGGVGISPIDETSVNDVDREDQFFLENFRGKTVKLMVLMEDVAQISFTKAPWWTPLYLLKKVQMCSNS